jgi:5-methylcytosine-specific restriction endonuclease McrA
MKPVTSTHIQVTLNLPNEVVAKLERLKMLMSHKNLSQSELINELCEIALDKVDPVRRGCRKVGGATKQQFRLGSEQLTPEPRSGSNQRRSVSTAPKVNPSGAEEDQSLQAHRRNIPARIRREIWKRDHGECSFKTPDGTKCSSKFKIQIDHIVPVAIGGASTIDNLRLLCRNHNLFAAVRSFGPMHMAQFSGRNSS